MRKLLTLFFLILSSCSSELNNHKTSAEEYAKSKKYTEAIAAYQKHIDARLKVKKRPEWENPYIYLLDIGDIYLEQGDVESALKNYELAEKRDVKQAYVNEHYRAVAAWYEKNGDLKKSLQILKDYSDRDPELFNMIMDRIAKQIVSQESSNRK